MWWRRRAWRQHVCRIVKWAMGAMPHYPPSTVCLTAAPPLGACLQREEVERLAAEAAEKLALEQADTDPNVWAIRGLVQGELGGCIQLGR